MVLIQVPRPPKNAANSNRSVSTLLRSQMEHLHEAEKRLPQRYRSETYINAIRTEAEAAEYIRKVTEAIHRAHSDAAERRAAKGRMSSGGISSAAVADTATPKAGRGSKPAKTTSGKNKQKK